MSGHVVSNMSVCLSSLAQVAPVLLNLFPHDFEFLELKKKKSGLLLEASSRL